MPALNSRHLLIGLAMLIAAGLAPALTPRLKVADQSPQINLETMIPRQFGEWKQEETVVSLIVSPELKSELDRIYNQVLTRNYINNKGDLIMLSIAYGDEQRGSTKVHRPEACYAAQGFHIGGLSRDFIDLSGVKLPVLKMIAVQGQRIEPVTYWIMVGDLSVLGIWEYKVARLKYALTGNVPYGMVIRVSTISAKESQSFRMEERFVREMLAAVPVEYRKVLTGNL